MGIFKILWPIFKREIRVLTVHITTMKTLPFRFLICYTGIKELFAYTNIIELIARKAYKTNPSIMV